MPGLIPDIRVHVSVLRDYSNELFEKHIRGSVREVFEEMGEVLPMAEIVGTVNPATMEKSAAHFSMIFQPMTFNPDTKDFYAHIFKKACQDFEAVGYTFMSECWMVTRKEYEPGLRPSEAPDRVEMVQVVIEFKDPKRSKLLNAPIIRTEGKAELGPWEEYDGELVGNRFGGMFDRPEDVS